MKKALLLLSFSAGLFLSASAQVYTVKGKVIDKNTKATLPFVNLTVTGQPQLGATADIDGNFTISSAYPISSLSFTYVGYRDVVVPIKDNSKETHIVVSLQQTAYQLGEVKILPGVNPALRIIKTAIANKDKNNPEKVHSFAYYAYNKLYCTADLKAKADSTNSLDSIQTRKRSKDTVKKEDSRYDFFSKQYLFLIESVSQRKFLYPGHNYEKVIASRTSGLKDSPFALVASQLQSFSFYPENINILGHTYLNPISNPGLKRYYYVIEDTLLQGKDSVFVISFHPKKNKNFDGMKGVVYINTNGYAIQNVIAQPISENNTITIHIQQKYEYIHNQQWFPVQLNSDLVFNNIAVDDSDVTKSDTIKDGQNKVKVVARNYIRDIVLDTSLRKRGFGRVEIEIAKDASEKTEDFWNKYRIDTLTTKEKNTYRVMDSVGKAMDLDKKLKWFEALAKGSVSIGITDWELNKILTYNGYEKFRLGLGFHTNDKLSRFISIGGYGAYGFGDKAFKYGGDVAFIFNPYSDFKLDFAYKNDVTEAGGLSFYNDNIQSLLSPEYYHNYFVNNMDKVQEEKVSLSFDALKYFQFNVFGDEQVRQATNSYEYGVTQDNVTLLTNKFQFTELGVGFRFAFDEKFLKSPLGMISLGTRSPIIWANITEGFNDVLNGQFNYTKYDVKIAKKIKIPQLGYSSIQVTAGYVNGNVPYTLLYNTPASYLPFSISADNSFETMRINEFASSKYVTIFYYHDFESFLIRTKNFRPHFKIVSSAGWGNVDNLSNHYNFAFKTMPLGYYESGLEINNLLVIAFMHLGIGGYYRYGPYSLSTPIDNFVAKFTVYVAL